MGAVWLRARSQLRHHWAATVGLALIVGLAGGVVLAAIAGARRTDAAFPAFRQAARGADLTVFNEETGDDPVAVRRARDWALTQPHVVDAAPVTVVILQVLHPGMPEALRRHLGFVQLTPGFPMEGRPLVVRGRLPRQSEPLEAAIDEEMAARAGVGVGDSFPVGLFTAAQFEKAGQGIPVPPAGPQPTLRITGILRQPFDLLPVHREQANLYVDSSDLYLTPAFWRRFGPDLSTYGYGVSVRLDSPASAESFRVAAVRKLGETTSVDTANLGGGDKALEAIGSTISLQVTVMVFFAGLTALAALVLLGQTLGRQIRLETDDAAVLRSIGFRSRDLVLTGIARSAVIGVLGAVVALLIAVVLSPLAPIGLARRAALTHGVDIDLPVLAIGVPLVFAFVVFAAILPSWRSAHPARGRTPRPSTVAAGLTAAAAPPEITTGVELALRSGSGRGAVPVRTALVAATVSVLGLVAAATYAFSAHGVVDHPDRYGVTWDVSVGNFASAEAAAAGEAALRKIDGLEAWSGLTTTGGSVGGERVAAVILQRQRGEVGPTVLSGRLPRGPDEVALGRETMHRLRLGIGDRVPVTAEGVSGRVTATVVGAVVLNTAGVDQQVSPGDGALFDWPVVTEGFHVPAGMAQPQVYLVRLRPGADRVATMRALDKAFPASRVLPLTPPDVDRLQQIAALPWLLGGMIGLLGAAATAHAVLSAVRRRRRDLAVLKTVGFVRRQVSTTIAVQASTFAVVAIALGVPLGIVVGRVAWRTVASGIGLDPVVVVPVLGVVLVCAATLAVVNVLAAVPGVMARRIRPAVALRAE